MLFSEVTRSLARWHLEVEGCAMRDNKSANTDPQLQASASPHQLWSSCLRR